MKVQVQWSEEPELLEAIVEALQVTDWRDNSFHKVSGRADVDNGYGDQGFIGIKVQPRDGEPKRTFVLELHEIR